MRKLYVSIALAGALALSGCAGGLPPEVKRAADAVTQACSFSEPVAAILEQSLPKEIKQACLIVNLLNPPAAPAEQTAEQVEACLALEPKLGETQDWQDACGYLVTLGVVDGMKIATLTAEAVRHGLDASYSLPRFIYHRGGASIGGCPDDAGSYYCPQTRDIYLDLDQLASFREPAYVIAHEVVHDVTWQMRKKYPWWPPYVGEHRIVYEQFADRISGYTAGFHKDRLTDAFIKLSQIMAGEVGLATQHQHGPTSERLSMFVRGYNGEIYLPQFESGWRQTTQ